MVGAGAGAGSVGGGFSALMFGPRVGPSMGSTMAAGGSKGTGGAEDGGSLAKYGKLLAGSLSGFGQGMMDQNMRRTYGTARSGGYHDLMENQQINRFVNARPGKANATKAKIQEILSDPALSHLFEGRM